MANTFLYGSSSPKSIIYNGNTVKSVIYNGKVVWQNYSLETGVFVCPNSSTALFSKLSGDMGAPACTMHIRAVGWKSSIDMDVPVNQGDKVTVSLHSPQDWGGWTNRQTYPGWTGYEILVTVGKRKYYTYYDAVPQYGQYGMHCTYSYRSEYEITDSSGKVTTGTPASWSVLPNGLKSISANQPETPAVLITIGSVRTATYTYNTQNLELQHMTSCGLNAPGLIHIEAIGKKKSIDAWVIDIATLVEFGIVSFGTGNEVLVNSGSKWFFIKWTDNSVAALYQNKDRTGKVVETGTPASMKSYPNGSASLAPRVTVTFYY